MGSLAPHYAGHVPVCTHAFSFPSSVWPASHRLRRPGRTGSVDELFGRSNRPFASRGGTLKSVKISRFQIDANLTDSFALRRASSRGDSNTCSVIVVGSLRACGASGQTTLLSAHLAANPARLAVLSGSAGLVTPLGSPGSYVYAHKSHRCDGQDHWFSDGHFSAEIDRKQGG